jgi:hypothetical protein
VLQEGAGGVGAVVELDHRAAEEEVGISPQLVEAQEVVHAPARLIQPRRDHTADGNGIYPRFPGRLELPVLGAVVVAAALVHIG